MRSCLFVPRSLGLSVALAVLAVTIGNAQTATVTGELKRWHKITLNLVGPGAAETSVPNPFSDYRMTVTFSNTVSGLAYLVPGYFAAVPNAADTSASSGYIWRAHLCPDDIGVWDYTISFRRGTDVAIDPSPTAGQAFPPFDGVTGSFEVTETDKTGRDLRGLGRLDYVGKHHLRFKGSGDYFLKAGADAPENFLAYDDFDNTPNTHGYRKSWTPHAVDFDPVDAGAYLWKGNQGSEMLGAVRYLSDKGMNAFSFLTFNVAGDDDNVFPHLLKVSLSTYQGLSDANKWDQGVYKDRFDVSKMAQWERVFEYADKKGMYLHFKTQETENELKMDGGDLGRERKLYYRELIARFGHHLALNWNLGEEINNATTAQKKAWAQYFYDTDPYHHHIVIHNGNNHYDLLGPGSKLTGFSLQTNQEDFSRVHDRTKNYIDRSDAAGKPWVVACDEPGDASHALRPAGDTGNSWEDGRKNAMWGNLMAGGAGCEFYFGYKHANSDLTCQDWRSRDGFWDYCRYALEFFVNNGVPFWNLSSQDTLVSSGQCLAGANTYVVYLPDGGTATLNLAGATGVFDVRWYDPRHGGPLQQGSVTTVAGGGMVSLGTAPGATSSDWAVLVRQNAGFSVNAGPDQEVRMGLGPSPVALNLTGEIFAPAGVLYTSLWTKVSGPGSVVFDDASEPETSVRIDGIGDYVLQLQAGNTAQFATDTMTVNVLPWSATRTNVFAPTDDVYLQGTSVNDNNDLRVEYNNRTTYIRFNVNNLPAGTAVTRATLRLTESSDTGNGTLRFWRGSHSSWTESTITAANAPTKAGQVGIRSGAVGDGETISVDVTPLVPAAGSRTVIVTMDSGGNDLAFGSRETDIGPELEIITEVVPPDPPELKATLVGENVIITWEGDTFQLQQAPNAAGPYTDVLPTPASPYATLATNLMQYYRLRWLGL